MFDLAITPDRGYCLSVRGMAREIANAYDLDYVDPADVAPLPADGDALPVTIEPGTGVLRFGLRPVTGIDPKAVSPWWMQRRLLLSGIRAISPAVDVTNYVMLELGHPMHAHDRSLITGGFKVRFAEPGETVVTLDDVERKLDPGRCAHRRRRRDRGDRRCDGRGHHGGARQHHRRAAGGRGVGSAPRCRGLSGGCICPARRPVATSAASIRPFPWPRWTGVRHCSPRSPTAQLKPTLTDWRGDPPRDDWSQPPVSMPVDLPDRTAGVDYADGTTQRRLTQIGADVVVDGDRVTATPPSWRPDLKQPADLVEEVLRLEGLEIIPSVLPQAPAGRGLTRGAEAAPRDREVVGAQRLCRDPADAVPARRGVRPVGPGHRRSAPRGHACPQPARVRPARRWPPRCCRGCWNRWAATFPAVRSTPRCSRSSRWSSRPRKPVLSNAFRPTVGPPTTRSRYSTRRCRISTSTSVLC